LAIIHENVHNTGAEVPLHARLRRALGALGNARHAKAMRLLSIVCRTRSAAKSPPRTRPAGPADGEVPSSEPLRRPLASEMRSKDGEQ